MTWPSARPAPPAPGVVTVWRLDLDAWAPAAWCLTDAERTHVATLRSTERRQRAGAVRSALRSLLAESCGAQPAALVFGAGPHGKPFLRDVPDLHFNLSHSDGLALVAVAREAEVGVDVERVRAPLDVPGIARRVLGADAAARLGRLTGMAQVEAFFDAWTRHEALAKGLGIGLARSLPPDLGAWRVQPLRVAPDYRAALAADGPHTIRCATFLPPA